MPYREIVITHLQIVRTWAEFARERDLQLFTEKHLENIAEWTDDAIAMIDTQHKLILELQNLISIGTKMMNGDEA